MTPTQQAELDRTCAIIAENRKTFIPHIPPQPRKFFAPKKCLWDFKAYVPKNSNQRFCCTNCQFAYNQKSIKIKKTADKNYIKNEIKKLQTEGINYKFTPPKQAYNWCLWCNSPIPAYPWQRFCGQECGAKYRKMEQAIRKQYFFNDNRRLIEEKRLLVEKQNYRLPDREVD